MDEKAVQALIDASLAKAIDPLASAIKPLTDKLAADEAAAAKAAADAAAASGANKVDDDAAVQAAIDARFEDYAKADEQINAAQLTESQSSELRARARKGEDIAEHIENAKKVLAEARAGRSYETHIGGNGSTGDTTQSFDVAGFGSVGG